ncbi:MAG: hypothetical protein DRJ38_10030 [Thermoprotei archaeon]|nr:MAG: hypothetical protein DRJ38_10030 [Thermoprotei archaeon]
MNIVYVRNCDVKRVLLGIPIGHKHLRLAIELSNGETLIFSEATIANIVRAYIHVETHPIKRAVELKITDLNTHPKLKKEYSKYQLLETTRNEAEIIKELTEIMESSCK